LKQKSKNDDETKNAAPHFVFHYFGPGRIEPMNAPPEREKETQKFHMFMTPTISSSSRKYG
jgi:hypothetical protein